MASGILNISEREELLYTFYFISFHFNSYPIQATNSGRQITLSLFLFHSALFDAIFILFILRFLFLFRVFSFREFIRSVETSLDRIQIIIIGNGVRNSSKERNRKFKGGCLK